MTNRSNSGSDWSTRINIAAQNPLILLKTFSKVRIAKVSLKVPVLTQVTEYPVRSTNEVFLLIRVVIIYRYTMVEYRYVSIPVLPNRWKHSHYSWIITEVYFPSCEILIAKKLLPHFLLISGVFPNVRDLFHQKLCTVYHNLQPQWRTIQSLEFPG
jgi:hypothetical protein